MNTFKDLAFQQITSAVRTDPTSGYHVIDLIGLTREGHVYIQYADRDTWEAINMEAREH